MDSILKLIRLSIRRDIVYDRIVVEMSGVSEPRNLRDDFQDSKDTHQVCCSMLQRVAVWCRLILCCSACCSVLQCVAVCCSVRATQYA